MKRFQSDIFELRSNNIELGSIAEIGEVGAKEECQCYV